MTILSNSFFVTRREYPNDEKMISNKLLIKSGMIYKNENGIYSYYPIGLKTLENIKKIIREELHKVYAEEIILPSIINSDTLIKTNNNPLLKNEIFRTFDKNNKEYILCPSDEELFTLLAKNKIQSYKDLHFTLFQINNRFRDEENTEYGLLRKKDFYMMNAYSFDANDGGLDISYDKMYQAFSHAFNRLGLDTVVVDANDENIKGIVEEEFQVLNEYGDNEVVMCTNCSYTANREEVVCKNYDKIDNSKLKKMELVKTPNVKTIKEVSEFLDVNPNKIIKSLVIKVDDIYKMILLRGESELNIKKIERLFKTKNITIPSSEELEKIGTKVGFIGPINCTMQIIADNEVKYMLNAICGSNKKNYHYINAIPGRDFRVNKYADLKLFDEKCLCPKCKGECKILNGIEVGQINKITDKYSSDYKLKYVDETNHLNYVHLGSYQIGIDRCLSAIVESHHDDKGIIWPMNVSPYKVAIVIANVNDKDSYKYAFNLYERLFNEGIDVLIDDRKESIGVKFTDMDLIGIPLRVTVGNKFQEGIVELKDREENETIYVRREEIILNIKQIITNKTI